MRSGHGGKTLYGARVGVLSVHGDRLTPAHWDAVGAPHDTPVMGTENGAEFTRVMLTDEIDLDYEAAERDMLEAGETLLHKHPDVGAIVCENHNMGPYAAALNARRRVPIFTVYTFVPWFNAGSSRETSAIRGARGATYGASGSPSRSFDSLQEEKSASSVVGTASGAACRSACFRARVPWSRFSLRATAPRCRGSPRSAATSRSRPRLSS